MRGVILVGHGSLRSGSGAAMIRVAAELGTRIIADRVIPAFLNYSRPTLAQAVEDLASQGVDTVLVQPYFLVAGKYVQEDLPAQVAALAQGYPALRLHLGSPLGAQGELVAIAWDRLRQSGQPPSVPWALLLVAHGTPYPEANGPITWAAARLARVAAASAWATAYLSCNPPDVLQAVELLAHRGLHHVVALPYFLQDGRHVREDIPRLLDRARARDPRLTIRAVPPLGYHPLLAEVVAREVQRWMIRAWSHSSPKTAQRRIPCVDS